VLWLYAVTDTVPAELPRPGLGGATVVAVRAGSLVAIAELVSAAPQADPQLLLEHDRAVRKIAEHVSAILPARFGQTLSDAGEVTRHLGEHGERLARALDHVRGCVQLTTRLVREDSGDAATAESTVEPEEADDPTVGPGRRFLQSRLRATRVPELDALCRHVAPIVRETRTRRGPTPAVGSAYHLVERDRATALVDAIRAVASPTGTLLRVSGPFPPWAFAES
jgi:hypothetical protein